jgi:mycofactocin system glycosyltransferase
MTTARRFVLDRSWSRHGDTIVAGSPLRILRLSAAGSRAAARLEDAAARAEPLDDPVALGLAERLIDLGAVHPVAGDSTRYGLDDITVVIPRHRRTDAGTAGDAAADAADPDAVSVRTITVDDGSQPPLPTATITLATNRGPAAARTAGLAAVETDLVAFIDDDVEVPADWLADLIGHFDDDRVALVAPRVASRPGRGLIERIEESHSPLDLGDEPARIRVTTRVSYVPAAAIICRRSALEAVGGFDETLRFGEDVDLVWRLDAAGWRCRYDPSVVVQHRPRATWSAWTRQRIDYASSSGPLARRHPGALAPARVSPWSLGAWALAIAGAPMIGLALGFASAAALITRLPMVPARFALGLAGRGHLYAGRQLAATVRRVWWPVVALAALRSSAARRVLVASALVHPATLIGDLCASVGIWRGSIAARTIDPLVVRVVNWPGRTTV